MLLFQAPGVDARAGAFAVWQLGAEAALSQVDSRVVEFLKILFSQEVYRYIISEFFFRICCMCIEMELAADMFRL